MNISLFTYTNEGARPVNEDSLGFDNDGKNFYAVLCDGLGGHNRGEVASKLAVEEIMSGISKAEEINADSLFSIMHKANNAIINKQIEQPEYSGMRTTAVGCVINNKEISYFNCGDSRFYYFSDGNMTCMTKDHSVPQMKVELGEMTFDDIRFDADRNKLLKVLGVEVTSEIGSVYRPIAHKPGDAFLLCSDGFWEYVLEGEMEIDLSKSASAKEWIEYMLVRLLLKFDGTNDNYTVIGGIIE